MVVIKDVEEGAQHKGEQGLHHQVVLAAHLQRPAEASWAIYPLQDSIPEDTAEVAAAQELVTRLLVPLHDTELLRGTKKVGDR